MHDMDRTRKIMLRFNTLITTAALALALSAGCKNRDKSPASQAQTTGANVAGVAQPGNPDTDLEAFRQSARSDIDNLDRRLQRLEVRESTRTSYRARIMLDEAKLRRDRLMDRITALKSDTWQDSRSLLDKEWDDVLTLTDQIGEQLGDKAH
jgi:hypothetical protein